MNENTKDGSTITGGALSTPANTAPPASAPALSVENGGAPGLLSRAEILSKRKLVFEDVPVEGWGIVRVKALTSGERDSLEASCMIADPHNPKKKIFQPIDFRAKLVARSAIDANGNRLFTDADVPALTALNAAEMSTLSEKAMKLSKITDDDVEELVKNSASDPADGS